MLVSNLKQFESIIQEILDIELTEEEVRVVDLYESKGVLKPLCKIA